jgi:hypothetical protein
MPWLIVVAKKSGSGCDAFDSSESHNLLPFRSLQLSLYNMGNVSST